MIGVNGVGFCGERNVPTKLRSISPGRLLLNKGRPSQRCWPDGEHFGK